MAVCRTESNNEPLLEIEETNTNQMKSNLKVFEYEGKDITFDLGNGDVMVNATEMAKAFNKLPKDYLKTQSANELINALSARTNILPTDLVQVMNGGSNYGTWMHETIALDFAQWLSVDFKLWCNDRIKELMKTGSTSFKVPQTYSEAMRLAADQAEEIEAMKPKVQYTDEVIKREGLLPISTIGQDYGLTLNFLILRGFDRSEKIS